jgi:diguanylate cyclase (GGDEF)-like protein/PAS domain S-box-containing protein
LSELSHAGFSFTARRVDTAIALRRELAEFAPDVVLSDFTMPAFDGFAAVSLVSREAPDTPCIFVSGTLGEHNAVRALQGGATDYVLKANLSRLPAAVGRAVRNARERTARQKAERELQLLRERLENIVSTVPDVLWSVAWPSREVLYLSPAFSKVFGRSVAEVYAQRIPWGAFVHPEDQSYVMEAWEQEPADAPVEVEYRILTADGAVRWIHQRARFARDDTGTVVRIDGISRDVTRRHEQQERIAYLSHYDSLTGLPNRELFRERITQLLNSARRSGQQVAVALGDVRRFRRINETLGRDAGDTVLRESALRLKQVWPEPETLARVGGATFAGAISRISDPAAVIHSLDKVAQEAFHAPFEVAGHEVQVALTSGIAVFPNDGDDVDTLLTNAETALLRAKAQRERYLFYQPQMNAHVAQLLTLESQLQRALEQEQFVLHYQPKIASATGRVTGVEALIRWQHPGSGLVPPVQFIRVLEETGLILEVGRWAIRKALVDARRWRSAGGEPLRVAVNVSAIQLQQRDFVQAVGAAIAELGGDCCPLDLEITESLLMHDIHANIQKLTALNSMGVRLSIDDFGTGYSSLAYLAQLPVHALKIDRSFIQGMVNSTHSRTIVDSVISLAHSLGVKVTAEGVETEEQAELLTGLRCDELQGYLYSRPLSADDLTDFLASR